jgi:hypothetical protein
LPQGQPDERDGHEQGQAKKQTLDQCPGLPVRLCSRSLEILSFLCAVSLKRVATPESGDPHPDQTATLPTFFNLGRASAPVLASITRPLANLLQPLRDAANGSAPAGNAVTASSSMRDIPVQHLASVDEGDEPTGSLHGTRQRKYVPQAR